MSKTVNKLFNTPIKTIKLPEYTSYYSPEYKYPLLVVENLKKVAQKPKISFVRAETIDPFRKYEKISADTQYSVEDYQLMKKYGLSPGHNAPAGHHKTTMENWGHTFYHINMTPQDIVLNAGVWLILEQWCNYLSRNPKLTNFIVLSGSIPAKEETDIEGLKVNIPPFMYKIVLATTKKHNRFYMACFLCPNKPIVPEGEATDINKYLIDIQKLSDMSGLNMVDIVNYIVREFKLINTQRNKTKTFKLLFGDNNGDNNCDNNVINGKSLKGNKTKKAGMKVNSPRGNNVKTIKYEFLGNVLRNGITYFISDNLKKSLINGKYFGLLINSKDINELDKHWNDYVKKNEKEKLNRSLEYHREYYDLAKERILANQQPLQYYTTE